MKNPWKVRVEWKDSREPVAVLRFRTKREAWARMSYYANVHGSVCNAMLMGRD